MKVNIKHLLLGDILKEEFVIRHSKLFALIAVLFVILISNGFATRDKRRKIEKLQQELKEVKYENLVISTELTSNSRLSQVEELLKAKGIELSGSSTPAIEIHK